MIHKKEKGLKPWLFRSLAVFIGICYLMAPMQQELTELMHFLSHSLDQGTGHHSFTSNTQDFYGHTHEDKAKVGASTYLTESLEHTESNDIAPHAHPHQHNAEPHSHEIIDFISMAFSASTPTHQDNDNIEVPVDMDKHLVVINYRTFRAITTFAKTYFSNIRKNTSKGIKHLIVPPPKAL
ncbi:hypothetical protein MWU78_09285 [Arenibacter sp. F26102]|uniref:hypothetical protein n=1 Tax=Arenibacter sp. F26102 TaxID=2926416 RepID=UPI001FF5729B|nr:hypothetical protein [Arenibacter sp. F26102]MCK0145835.1 hypothetical protein [Arenibacter sp. F26102]